MKKDLYYVPNGSGRWQDVACWSRDTGGAPAGVRPSLSDVVVLDENSGTARVDLRGVACGGYRISGFKGTLVTPQGGTLDLTSRKPRTRDRIAEWLRITRPPEPAMSQFTRERLLLSGWSWQASVRMRLASLHGPQLLLVSRGDPTIVNLVTYYWVGGTGTWDGVTTTHWSLTSGGVAAAGPPTASDIATFDANSGLGSGGTVTVASTSACGGCSISGINSKTVIFSFSGNTTWSAGTYSLQGNSQSTPILFQSNTVSTTRTLTINGTYGTNSDVSFMDITIAGTGGALTGTRIGDGGGNSGTTFTPSVTQTWNGTSGGNWSTNAWTSRVPLLQDDVVISSAFTASQTITVDMPRIGRSINFTGSTGTPTLSLSLGVSVFGSMTLISGMTLSGSQIIMFVGRSSYALISANKLYPGSVQINAPGGVYTLQDDLSISAGFRISNGGIVGNGHNVTAASIDNATGTTMSVTLGNGTWTATGSGTAWSMSAAGLTFSGASATVVLTDASSSLKFFSGGGNSYGALLYKSSGSGALTILGNNTFGTLDLECTTARTVTLPASGTQTVTSAFTRQGATGQLLSFVSSSPGTATKIILNPSVTETSSFNTLSSDVTIDLQFTVSVGGAGSLTATVTPYQRITAALAGTSTLTVVVTPYQRIVTALTGRGTLTATVTPFKYLMASLTGEGTLAAAVTPTKLLTVNVTGTGTIIASLVAYQRITVALAGSSTVSVIFYSEHVPSGGSITDFTPYGQSISDAPRYGGTIGTLR